MRFDPRDTWPVLLAVAAGLAVALGFTLPRALLVPELVDENFALRERLIEIEARLAEVDRLLLRWRVYEAQLQSLQKADGGAGPVEGPSEPWPVVPDDPVAWADDLLRRVDEATWLGETVEPDVVELVHALDALEALDRALPSYWPAAGFLTSSYGWRRNPVGYGMQHHKGIDVGGQERDPVFAASAGTVVAAGPSRGFGNLVVVDHGHGVQTLYAHCHRILVEEGERVRRGQQLAVIGATGRTTGPHLHFEVRLDGAPVDPLGYLPERRGWVAPWATD